MSVGQDLDPGFEAGLVLLSLCLVLFIGLVLGLFGLAVALCTIGLYQSLGWRRRALALITFTGFILLLVFGRPADDAFWHKRFDLVWQVFITDGAIWNWIQSLNICPEALAGGLLLAAFILAAFELWNLSPYRRLLKRQRDEQQQRKTSFWARRQLSAVNRQSACTDKRETILGVEKHSGRLITIPDSALNTHMLISGTTGSGKTVSLLNFVESFIDRGLPVIFIDGKGDRSLAEQITAYAKENNRKHRLFSMTGASCVYDPFTGDYTALKDKVIALRRHWSEEHYLKLAEGYLQMVFKVLQETGQTVSLHNIAGMFELAKLTQGLRLAEKEGRVSTDHAKDLMQEIEAQKEAAKHVESLRAELSNLASSSLASLFDVASEKSSENVLRLKDVLAENGIATLVLYPLAYPEVSGVIGRLILNDLKTCLEPQKPKKVLLIIDEISTLVSASFLNFLNQGRYVGLHIILTAQSIADLGQKIPDNAKLFIRQIVANCNLFVIHKLNDTEDAEYLASILGTSLGIDYTAEVSGFGSHSSEGSARLVHEFLVHPDQIKALKRGEGFFCDKNSDKSVVAFLGRKGKLAE